MEAKPSSTIPVLDYAPAPRRIIDSPWFQRWLRWLAGLLLVIAGAALGMTLAWGLTPLRYTAVATVYVNSPGFGLSRADTQLSVASAIGSSANLREARLSKRGSAVPAAEWDRAEIRVEVERRSNLIRLSVTHPNARSAAGIARAVLDSSVASVQPGTDVLERPRPASQLIGYHNLCATLSGAIIGALVPTVGMVLWQRRKHASTTAA